MAFTILFTNKQYVALQSASATFILVLFKNMVIFLDNALYYRLISLFMHV
jgi:hypothetical protein